MYESVFLKKKRSDLLKRFGVKKYKFNIENKTPVIWIHAVSLGETKASASLIEKLKIRYPNSFIIVSNITDTGHIEAKKNQKIDQCIFMPFDFSFIQKHLLKQVSPDITIIIETDLWYNFLKYSKKYGSKIYLVSAKISKRSKNRFKKVSFFTKKLFSYFDKILTQNKFYSKSFEELKISKDKILISGNLKFSVKPKLITSKEKEKWIKTLKLENSKVITIASTHHPEEKLILAETAQILKNFPKMKILMAPRHPERFSAVLELLKTSSFKIGTYSNRHKLEGTENIILIDEMGLLNQIYQLSDIAIVGGSFVDRVGGHNILEPAYLDTFVLFGPFMNTQADMVEKIHYFQLGKKVFLSDIPNAINNYYSMQNKRFNFEILKKDTQDITDKTLNLLKANDP